jgi:predicted metal-binding membrane protein
VTPVAPPLERVLRRDGAITLASLFVLWALTWAYLATGAGLGMDAWDMTRLALLPQPPAADAMASMPGMDSMPDMPGMAMDAPAPTWDLRTWALMIAMWWAMMVAMMTPGAAPTVLLFTHVHRHAQAQGALGDGRAPIAAFVAGYFVAWLLFSIAATALHALLEGAGAISAMTMGSQVRWLSGGALIATGVYQLTPFKNACLSHCRAPAQFLSQHWRPGARGALRLGVVHGAYCVGCCWMLMALLFVGGVMNLAWIAALSLLVLAEKVLARGRWVGYCAGAALIAWGVVILMRM